MKYRRSESKEAARALFKGCWAAIPTPFHPDGSLDEAGLRQNMRHYTDNLKIDGIFCTGVMGEFWALTKEERKRSVEIVVEEAQGKCLVIAHTACHSAHETIELTRHAEEVGADFAILINPYFPVMSEPMVYEWFSFVANRVDIGIWMFDTGYAGYGLSPELTARIAELENVCGIKAYRPRDHYDAIYKLCGDKIVISDPDERAWLDLMKQYNQRVHMSSPVPYLYQTKGKLPMHDYAELGLQGKFEQAETIARQLEPAREVYDKWLVAPWRDKKLIPIAYLKAWTELMGMKAGPVRPPLLQITDDEREELRADLKRAGLI